MTYIIPVVTPERLRKREVALEPGAKPEPGRGQKELAGTHVQAIPLRRLLAASATPLRTSTEPARVRVVKCSSKKSWKAVTNSPVPVSRSAKAM